MSSNEENSPQLTESNQNNQNFENNSNLNPTPQPNLTQSQKFSDNNNNNINNINNMNNNINNNNNNNFDINDFNNNPSNRINKVIQPKGQKTIVCWNCLSVLMVKEEWNVVECTSCHKFNRIPHDDSDNFETAIYLNENMNHFDLKIPYVYGIITCPFCSTENRFRRDAQHIICYKCHHSFSLSTIKENSFNDLNTGNKIGGIRINKNGGFENANTYLNQNPYYNVPQKLLRFSDFYSPDIMFWKGYYPQPYIFNSCDCQGTENLLKELLKKVKKKKKFVPLPPVDNYGPLRSLVRDIDDIDNRRRDNVFKYNFNKKYFSEYDNDSALENYKNRITSGNNIYNDDYINNFNNNNNYNRNNNLKYNDNNLSRSYSLNKKSNAIYNMMFGGNRTPNPYNNYYRYENLY
jgi:uncharacterized CHY-type Zn-finger protein